MSPYKTCSTTTPLATSLHPPPPRPALSFTPASPALAVLAPFMLHKDSPITLLLQEFLLAAPCADTLLPQSCMVSALQISGQMTLVTRDAFPGMPYIKRHLPRPPFPVLLPSLVFTTTTMAYLLACPSSFTRMQICPEREAVHWFNYVPATTEPCLARQRNPGGTDEQVEWPALITPHYAVVVIPPQEPALCALSPLPSAEHCNILN